MELTLLGSVGLLAFVIGGAAVMLVVSFRRTIELRGALIQAMKRIDRLEQALSAGAPPSVANAETASANVAAPRLEAATAETSFTNAADAALKADAIEPPPLGVLSFVAGLAAFAALAAAEVRWLSGSAGVELAIAIGLAVLAAAEWRRRVDTAPAPANAPFKIDVATISALIAFVIMASAIAYGWGELNAVPPLVALSALGVIALGAIALSQRHGPALLAFGLAVGALAPVLMPVDSHAPPLRYLFLAALLALTMVLTRRGAARYWTWCAAAIALGWGAKGAAWGGDATLVAVVGAYFAALAGLGIINAWDTTLPSPSFPAFWRTRSNEAQIVGATLISASAAGLVLLTLADPAPVTATGIGFIVMAAFSAGALAMRPGLWFAPFVAVLAAAIAMAFWPAANASSVPDAPGLVVLAALLAFVFSTGGAASMATAKDVRPGATLAALAPILIFAAAHERIGGFGAREYWAVAVFAVALVNGVALLQIGRTKPEAAAPFAAGAALAAAAALYAETPAPYAPLALAVGLPLIALVNRWREQAGFGAAALALCVLIAARLLIPQLFVQSPAQPTLLVILFLTSAVAALIAAFVFAPKSNGAESAFALAFVLAAACGTLEARHFFTAGNIGAPYASLAEMSLDTLIWLALALVMAWRFGAKPRAHLFALELLAFGFAAANALIAGGLALNPWWGFAPGEAAGWRGFNLIELAYAAPALLFLLYAQLRATQKLEARAGAALSAGLALLFLAIVLELRRLFHGASMAHAPVSVAEAWTYSLAALGFAALMFALATERNIRTFRFAALGLAVAALGKMALSDVSTLDGLQRLGAFLALIALIGGLIWISFRGSIPAGLLRFATRPKTADPKPSQPG